MLVSEVLEEARDLIEGDGWIQGTYFSNEGSRCMVRACWDVIAARGLEYTGDAKILLNDCIRVLGLNAGVRNLAVWNDCEERTLSQVLEVFNRAINDAQLIELREGVIA